MVVFSDYEAYCVMAKESNYAVAPGTITTFPGIMRNIQPKYPNNHTTNHAIGSRLPSSIKAGNFHPELDMTFEVINGHFFEYILGSVSGAGTTESPFEYEVGNTPPSATFEHADKYSASNNYMRLLGAIANSCKITGREKEDTLATMNWKGKTITKSTTFQTLTSPDVVPYSFYGANVHHPDDGSALTEIVGFDLDITAGVTKGEGVGQGRFSRARPGPLEFKLNVRPKLQNSYWYDMMLTGAGSATAPGASGPAAHDVKIALTNGDNYINIIAEDCVVDSANFNYEKAQQVEGEIPLIAKNVTVTEVDEN